MTSAMNSVVPQCTELVADKANCTTPYRNKARAKDELWLLLQLLVLTLRKSVIDPYVILIICMLIRIEFEILILGHLILYRMYKLLLRQ